MLKVTIQARLFLFYLFGLSALPVSNAVYDPNSKQNVAVYWGQGPNQKDLIYYCQQPTIDIIILSFIDLFPAQGNGYPGSDFGSQCKGGVYPGPGYNGVKDRSKDELQSNCPGMVAQLSTCQATYNKRILLSLGGGEDRYQLDGAQDGNNFATLLWGMFGPRTTAWVRSNLPRPFDYNGQEFQVDGFDLDIEHEAPDGGAGYVALVTRLQYFFKLTPSRKRYLTLSPECPIPTDSTIAAMVQAAAFDIIFIQFYNTPTCSAASWVTSNPNYVPGQPFFSAGLTLDAWISFLATTPSSGARVFAGIPGSTSAANTGSYVNVTDMMNFVSAHYCRAKFTGVAIWDATYADRNLVYGLPFYVQAKAALGRASRDSRVQKCPTAKPTGVPVSYDGSCGPSIATCQGLTKTPCCSQFNFCGSGSRFCGSGCQKGFGSCS